MLGDLGSKKLVLLLGMHRSGTSSLAGTLKSYGLHLGNQISERNNHNAKGNQELIPARAINHRLIKASGGSWYQPTVVVDADDKTRAEINSIKTDLFKGGEIVGIKDPRMLFCLDLWKDEDTVLVGTIRHPAQVYRSLEFRNSQRSKKVEADWFNVWIAYNKRLLNLYERGAFPIVDFGWEAVKYQNVIKNIAESIGLVVEHSGFFESELRHDEDIRMEVPKLAIELYDRLAKIAEYEALRFIDKDKMNTPN